jgi:hypothetical protein
VAWWISVWCIGVVLPVNYTGGALVFWGGWERAVGRGPAARCHAASGLRTRPPADPRLTSPSPFCPPKGNLNDVLAAKTNSTVSWEPPAILLGPTQTVEALAEEVKNNT